jgi:type II secretory pathway component PulK
MRLSKKIEEKKGIALIMALWIMTILLVVAASFAFMMRTEIRMAKNYRDGMKAHYLALAGVEHAVAAIQNDEGPTDHYGEGWFTTFADNFVPADVTWDAHVFTLGDGTYAVHLSDENSKCDLNWANARGLYYLMTPKPALASTPSTWANYCRKVCNVADYVDTGSTPQTYQGYGGTETGSKDTPFDTLREIQKVTGINLTSTAYTSTGYDNPLDTLNPAESWVRGDDTDMTVYALDYNTPVDSTSTRSVDVKDADATAFESVGFDSSEATLIVNERTYSTGGTGFLDYGHPWDGKPDVTQGVGAPGYATPNLQNDITAASMIRAADRMTAGNYDSDIIHGTVNINTATFYGLASLWEIGTGAAGPAQAIINTRSDLCTCKGPDGLASTGDDDVLSAISLPPYSGGDPPRGTPYFHNRGEIMMVYDPGLGGSSGISKSTFQAMADLVTVRTNRFRIYSTGTVGSAVRRIEAVVDRDGDGNKTKGDIKVLYWSEKVFED